MLQIRTVYRAVTNLKIWATIHSKWQKVILFSKYYVEGFPIAFFFWSQVYTFLKPVCHSNAKIRRLKEHRIRKIAVNIKENMVYLFNWKVYNIFQFPQNIVFPQFIGPLDLFTKRDVTTLVSLTTRKWLSRN